jgi:hypothetical protein
MYFGTPNSGLGQSHTKNAAITAEEAWNIDKKMDDGKPAYGKVLRGSSDFVASCVNTITAASSEYDVSSSGNVCSLTFVMGF